MRVIAVVNQKGGSGKTTTAVNLAAGLSDRQRRVLVVDLDPQASATAWLGLADSHGQHDGSERRVGLYQAFVEGLPLADLVVPTGLDRLEAVAASDWLVGVEVLAGQQGVEQRLKGLFGDLPRQRWDYVVLDCPPTLGILTANALAAAGEALITVEARVLALRGVVQLFRTIEQVRQRFNPRLEVCGILACRVDGRTRHAQEVVEELRKRFGSQVYQTIIRENIRLAECPSFARPIFHYAPKCSGALDYGRLTQEIMDQERSC